MRFIYWYGEVSFDLSYLMYILLFICIVWDGENYWLESGWHQVNELLPFNLHSYADSVQTQKLQV